MKIGFICSNYSLNTDGIGNYSARLVERLKDDNRNDVVVFSSKMDNDSNLRLFTSLKMTRAIIKSLTSNVDAFVIEYPFMEKSVIVILAFILIKIYSVRLKKKIILSVHEYVRVNKLRRFLIDFLTHYIADVLFVTDEKTKSLLDKHCKTCCIREIPGNITIDPNFDNINSKVDGRFVFFGLISTTKAYNEMIQAWKVFHKSNKGTTLYILTSSPVENVPEDLSIKIIRNLDSFGIAREMCRAKYAICPILPEIGTNNATLKVSIDSLCIPIGKFSKEIESDAFVCCKNYSVEELCRSLESAYHFDATTLKAKYDLLKTMKAGLPTFTKVAQLYLSHLTENR